MFKLYVGQVWIAQLPPHRFGGSRRMAIIEGDCMLRVQDLATGRMSSCGYGYLAQYYMPANVGERAHDDRESLNGRHWYEDKSRQHVPADGKPAIATRNVPKKAGRLRLSKQARPCS